MNGKVVSVAIPTECLIRTPIGPSIALVDSNCGNRGWFLDSLEFYESFEMGGFQTVQCRFDTRVGFRKEFGLQREDFGKTFFRCKDSNRFGDVYWCMSPVSSNNAWLSGDYERWLVRMTVRL
ncbi:hypothetical protein EAF00_002893 [Botryotinia globosa]|nr:hypothetical protein EAF00_002893 [Botryotinia globosa]